MPGTRRTGVGHGGAGAASSRRLSGRDVCDLARVLAALSVHRGARTVAVHGLEVAISAPMGRSGRQQLQEQQQGQQRHQRVAEVADVPPDNAIV